MASEKTVTSLRPRPLNPGHVWSKQGLAWGYATVASLLLIMGGGGCDRAAEMPSPTTPPTESPSDSSSNSFPDSPTKPPADTSTEPAPTVEPPPTPGEPVAQAPSVPSVPSAPLPDALVKQWEPMSNVLLAFGPMTLTSGEITWGSGQTSPYTLISTEGGFLLKLEANPSFYDINHPYIKLIPKTDESGTITTVEVAFYEGEAQAQRDEYMMYGTYFVN
jgi:hypothetical protein